MNGRGLDKCWSQKEKKKEKYLISEFWKNDEG